MLKYIFYICCGIFLSACHAERNTEIYVRITGGKPETPTALWVGEKRFFLTLDSMGEAMLELPSLEHSSEGMLTHGEYLLPLFIEPFRSFEIHVSLYPDDFGAEFYGAGALKNEIWNGKYFRYIADSVYILNEEAFIKVMEESFCEHRRILDSLETDHSFTDFVGKKAELVVLEELIKFPQKHAILTDSPNFFPSASYLVYVNDRIKQREHLLKEVQYRRLLSGWIPFYVGLTMPGKDAFQNLKYKLSYIDSSFIDSSMKEYLVDKFITDYIKKEGTDSLYPIKSIYENRVKDSSLKVRFNAFCQSLERIKAKHSSQAPFFGKGDTLEPAAGVMRE